MLPATAIQAYFERNAARFDGLYEPRGLAWAINRVFRKALFVRAAIALEECSRLPGGTVLDVGCGSGRNSLQFLREGKASRVLGIDFSGPMIALARDLARREGARADFLQADFMSWDEGAIFDLVVALGIFDYLSDPVPFLAKMFRHCRRTLVFSAPGYSLIRTPLRAFRYSLKNCPVRFYTRKGLARICEHAGLGCYELRRIASSGFIVIGRRRTD